MSSAVSTVSDAVEDAVDTVTDAVEDAIEWGNDVIETVEDVVDFIAENPIAVAQAFLEMIGLDVLVEVRSGASNMPAPAIPALLACSHGGVCL